MNQPQRWGRTTDEASRTESVRTIVKRARAESRILVRQIYREQIEDGVRSKIARLMRRKRTPWYTVEEDTKPTRNTTPS